MSRLSDFLKTCFGKISRVGLSDSDPRELRKKIRLTNVISLVIGCTAIPYLIAYALQSNWWPLFTYNLLFVAACCLALLLNWKRQFYLSRWYLILIYNLVLLVGCYLTGRMANLQLGYFILVCLPLMLFDLKDRRSIFALMAIPFVLYFIVETQPQFAGTRFPDDLIIGRTGEALLIMLILVGIVYYFRVANERYETELENLVQQVTAQQQVIAQSSKMSALGEMAGGIAHEINTPLAVIQLRVSYLKALTQKGELNSENVLPTLAAIDETIWRISKIIKGLRSFAREGLSDPFRQEPVEKLVSETLDLCRERFKIQGAKIEVGDISPHLTVECRAVQVIQILLNLMNNAFDAIRDQSEKWVRIEIQDDGDSVNVAVIDSGPGVPQELRDKIFQPFFTTKGVGAGTGLGLSISRGIAESEHGSLLLDPTSTHTRFVLVLRKSVREPAVTTQS